VSAAKLRGAAIVALAACLAWPSAASAQEEDNPAVGRIALLNRKAIEEYQNLNFDQALSILHEALDLTTSAGLTQHPIRARTYMTLGIVTLGGLKQREEAIKLFRKALQIQPEIGLSRAMANPQIQDAFNEAIKGLATEPKEEIVHQAAVAELPPEKLLAHELVRSAVRGYPVAITVSPDRSLPLAAVVLGYRPAGASIFTEVKMQRAADSLFSGTIPGSATAGGQVEYYIEARRADGKRLASRGSSVDAIVVTLADSLSSPAAPVDGVVVKKAEGESQFVFALMVGTGFGWTSGVGEVRQVSVSPSGIAWARLGHLAPELGYFVSPHMMLAVQGRFQLVTGATEYRPPASTAAGVCGGDGVCSPAKGAFAGLVKASWFFNQPTSSFRPYVSLSVGAGQIRHVAQAGNKTDCGASQTDKCLDTVAAGPALFGPSFGFHYQLSRGVAAVLALEWLVGAPNFTVNADANLGMAFQF
jgi:tetratricopeptide (TPR) repeat protein